MPDNTAQHVLLQMLRRGLERSEEARLQLVELLSALQSAEAVSLPAVSEALRQAVDGLEDGLEVLERAAGCLAAAVTAGLLPLAEVAAECEGGAHFPLFFIVLQRLSEQTDSQQLSDQLANTKVSRRPLGPVLSRVRCLLQCLRFSLS